MTYYGQSDMGRQRTNNEDAFVLEQLDNHTLLAIAIDGVGGYEGGEVAAEIAQKTIPSYLKDFKHGERLELLKQAVVSANNSIYERRLLDSERQNMSCVLTAALIDTERKVVDMVHVGDTRMYQFRHGELVKISHDHSLIGYREEIGDLSEEDAMHHPQRNVISRDVGSERHEVEDPDFLEAEEFPLLPNTTFLLCSDGLTDLITSKQISTVLEQQLSLETKVQKLIDAANEAGGKDNVTVVLAEYQAEEEVKPIVDIIPQSSEDNKRNLQVMEEKPNPKRKHKIGVWLLSVILALLLGCCIALLSSQHSRMKKLEKQIEQLNYKDSIFNHEIKDSLYNSKDSIMSPVFNPVKTIALYAKAIEDNNFQFISQVFASNVRRYFDLNNTSNTEVMKRHQQYDNRYGVKDKHVNIRWETWETEQLPDGEMLVSFIEDYSIERTDSTKQSDFQLYYHIIFDKEGKITSCYYNEL